MSTNENHFVFFVPACRLGHSTSHPVNLASIENHALHKNSFLCSAPSIRPYSAIQRRVSARICATLSSVERSAREERTIHIACTIIHSSFEQAVRELMFPSRHDARFIKCYELVAAILYAKRNNISRRNLECEIISFSHSQQNESLPCMTSLQQQTIQSVLRKVYDVDNLLQSHHHCRGARYYPSSNEKRMEYDNLQRFIKQGRQASDVLKEIYQCDVGKLKDMVKGKPPEIASRISLPSRWASVLAVLTTSLREHMRFS